MTAPSTSSAPAVNDIGKLLVLMSAILAAVVMALFRVVSGDAAFGVILIVVGYVTGNGVLARRQQAPSTVLAPKLQSSAELEDPA